MRLANGHRAHLGTKLEDYVLSVTHREGRHRARMFESVLGVTASSADVLRRALLDAAAASDEAEARGDTGFGKMYVWRVPLGTAKGSGGRLPQARDLLYRVSVETEILMHALVALLGDVHARHFETGRSLRLRRGQIGTVVMTYDGTVVEVEFAGKDGRAYAILPVPASKLMILRDTPDHAVA